jgi:hypothetical protein
MSEATSMTIEEAFRVAEQLSPLPSVAHKALQVLVQEVQYRWEQRTALSFRLQDLRAIASTAGLADDSPLYLAIHDATATAEGWMHPGTLGDAARDHLARLKETIERLTATPVEAERND